MSSGVMTHVCEVCPSRFDGRDDVQGLAYREMSGVGQGSQGVDDKCIDEFDDLIESLGI